MPTVKKQDVNNKSIKDFFKPFTIPKSRIPANDIIEDEIIVSSQPKSSSPTRRSPTRKPLQSPRGRQNGDKSPRSSQGSSTISTLSSSPAKRSTPRTTPKLQETVRPKERQENGPLIHISPAGSQQRIMAAVEIRSPRPVELKEEGAAAGLLNTSFSTISTLSSIPASTASSSRRITTKSGIQAITNSDSGSAESSSEDELADMSTFIPRKRPRLTPPEGADQEHAVEVPNTAKLITRRTVRASKSSEQLRGDSTPTAPPTYKYSLAALVKQQQKDQNIEKRMRDIEDASSERQRQRDERKHAERLAASGLQAAVTDDSDEGERVMLAMQRTGALEDEEKFYLFDGIRHSVVDEDSPDALDGEPPWIQKLRKKRWRVQACLSGFAAELAKKDGVPPAIQIWMARRLIYEQREDLCDAYTSILEACQSSLSEESWLPLFHKSGSIASLDVKSRKPSRLEYVLRLAQHITSARIDQSAAILRHLIFATIDTNLEQHAPSRCAIEDCIETILGQIPADSWKAFYRSLESHIVASGFPTYVKCKAVAAIPARSESSYIVGRLLATRLVLHGLDPIETGHHFSELPAHPQCADGILLRLKTAPEFSISEMTDYSLLNLLVQVLEIAIGNGFDQTGIDKSSKDFTRQFNAQVDGFIDQLNVMESRIRDAGTTHLRRTQAKSAIERLAKRLEYGVRTKPKPRKGVFSNGHVVDEQQQDFLKGFFKAREEKTGALSAASQEVASLGALVES